MKRLSAIFGFAAVLAFVLACSSTGTTGSTGTSGSTGTTATGSTGTTSSGTTASGTTSSGTTTSGSTTTSAATTTPSGQTAEPPRTGDTSTMSQQATSAVGTAASAAGVDLAGTLGSQLGLSSDQSAGAVGAVMSLAQTKLPATDYSKVSSAVPGADQYVQKAKDLGAVPSTGIGDKAGLDAAYQKLGINPQVASQVTPLVVQYAGKVGGPTVQSLLTSVIQ